MADREKVIKGLECCAKDYRCFGPECPYKKPPKLWSSCNTELARDALSLLKAQEPRVLTVDEVKAIPYDDDIWIETEYYVGKITIFAATINTKGLRGVMVYGSHKTYDYEAYNKLWRCWTARPTNEQRKAVKWDENRRMGK